MKRKFKFRIQPGKTILNISNAHFNLCVSIKSKFVKDSAHGGWIGVNSLKRCRVVGIKVVDKNQKFSEAAFFEHSHETTWEGLCLVSGHFVNFLTL